MELHFSKAFVKAYRKLSLGDQKKVDAAILLFQRNPFHSALRNHPLKGRLLGKRAISAGFDLRVIYREENEHTLVLLLNTGTHNQVY